MDSNKNDGCVVVTCDHDGVVCVLCCHFSSH